MIVFDICSFVLYWLKYFRFEIILFNFQLFLILHLKHDKVVQQVKIP